MGYQDNTTDPNTGTGEERVTLSLSAQQVRRLQALLPRTNYASREELLQAAVAHFLAFLEDDIAKTEEAIAQADRGEGIPHEEMQATFDELRRKARAAREAAEQRSAR
jgi:predicted transcriptional regulator